MTTKCSQCQAPKALLNCGPCGTTLCKACARLIDDGHFDLIGSRPAALVHEIYCEPCYQTIAAPELEAYEAAAARAADVNVFYRTQGKESRFIRRTEKPLTIDDCADRDEAILKLAFQAARAGFNTLVDVEVDARKVRNGGWQSSIWSGRGVPARVDQAQLNRRFLHAPN